MASESRMGPLVYGALMVQTAVSAGTYLAAKHALSTLNWQTLVTVRNVGASLLLVLMLALLPGPALPPRRHVGRVVLLGLLAIPINQGLFISGLARTSPVHAALLYTLTPAFVLTVGLFLGREQASLRKVTGLLLAMLGAMVVVLGRAVRGGATDPLRGDLMILVAVVAWALYTVLGRDLVREAGPLKSTAWALIAGTVMLLPFGLGPVRTTSWSVVPASVFEAMAFLIVLTSVVSYLCWSYALAHAEPSRVAVFTNLQPVLTALLAWFVTGERLGPTLVVGGLLVLAGVWGATVRRGGAA
jgi:drug/metabolite transporter (DMT)-like permease